MSRQFETPFGTVQVLSVAQIFDKTVDLIEATAAGKGNRTIALTGGSTPKAFYEWAAGKGPFSRTVIRRARWYTSDERMVPLDSDESNFGVAQRGMLDPLKIDEAKQHPWPVTADPHSAAAAFNMRWEERFGRDECYDLCLLGMGDDGHTASIFPGSPLLRTAIPESFTCVDVPGKGWRLTITRAGLERCSQIVVTVCGAKKASVLKEVLEGPADTFPVQMLAEFKERVLWLVDEEAAAELAP